jgi:hypothetical protein
MNIKDLAIAQELSHEERAAVRGGTTINQLGANIGGTMNAGGGFSFASPVTQVQGPQLVLNNATATDVNVSNIVGSAFSGALQSA